MLTCKKLSGKGGAMMLTIILISLGTIYRELYTVFYLMVEVYCWIGEFTDTVVYGFFVLDNTFYLIAYILTIWKWLDFALIVKAQNHKRLDDFKRNQKKSRRALIIICSIVVLIDIAELLTILFAQTVDLSTMLIISTIKAAFKEQFEKLQTDGQYSNGKSLNIDTLSTIEEGDDDFLYTQKPQFQFENLEMRLQNNFNHLKPNSSNPSPQNIDVPGQIGLGINSSHKFKTFKNKNNGLGMLLSNHQSQGRESLMSNHHNNRITFENEPRNFQDLYKNNDS
ncbi:UNKNOWN [Stylonychia lemnae]|uniref:Uncharacterized protein n=1 Tax=Stylonychia lemnae TaxID=5949 RepID=A0A078AJB9_STYLE|nr:UNKNOWN [Stylonychia lemnae]|eukprot:CDW82410.1 UNKNOWN [Stylonychia lemnae]